MNKKWKYEKFSFNEKEMSVINGLLLSDGGINKKSFNFFLNSSSLEFIMFIKKLLPEYVWCDNHPQSYEYYDKRTNKIYKEFRLSAKSNLFWYELKEKWYPNDKKMVPLDLKLDKLCNLIWYLGDGSIDNRENECVTNNIKLSTNSFCCEEIENILIKQLKEYEAKIGFNEKKPIINIPRRNVEKFLKDIGKCPFEDYKHKWVVYPYKNKNIEKNGFKDHKYLIPTILEMHKDGENVNNIGLKLNLDSGLVLYYCKKNGIYVKKNRGECDLKSPDEKIHHILDLKGFAKENDLGYDYLLKLKNNKIKKYRGWTKYEME